jgi:hypothetical protein
MREMRGYESARARLAPTIKVRRAFCEERGELRRGRAPALVARRAFCFCPRLGCRSRWRAAASLRVAPGATEVQTPGLTDDERRTIVELAGHSDRDDAERDGKRASLFMAGCQDHFGARSRARFSRRFGPLPSPEVKRLGLVRRTEVLRNG